MMTPSPDGFTRLSIDYMVNRAIDSLDVVNDELRPSYACDQKELVINSVNPFMDATFKSQQRRIEELEQELKYYQEHIGDT